MPNGTLCAHYVAIGLTNILTTASSSNAIPNVQTIAAPVGRSAWNEIMIPIALTTAPIVQPMARRFPIDRAKSMAATDGTMRYEKTRILVFSYLIVPSVAAMLFARSIGKRLAIGWTMGAVVSAIGIMISFQADLPTGAAIVCTFGIALLLLAVVRMFVRPMAT